MLHFVKGIELQDRLTLAASMFKDRALQFRERLDWDVQVDENGQEKDEYDLPDTLYAIQTSESGLHQGSMRFRATTSANLTKEHFSFDVPDAIFVSPLIWECTRFCISDTAKKSVALNLFAAGAQVMKENDLQALVAVFDGRMERLYRRYGLIPEVIGSQVDKQGNSVKIGLWHRNEALEVRLAARSACKTVV